MTTPTRDATIAAIAATIITPPANTADPPERLTVVLADPHPFFCHAGAAMLETALARHAPGRHVTLSAMLRLDRR